MPVRVEPGSRGIVFATTGPVYTAFARRAAHTVRGVMPDVPIDLFTDQDVADPVFDQVHAVKEIWFRPKIEAIRRTRFERSLFLDSDVMVLRDVSEAFDILDRCDLAAAVARARMRVMMRPEDGVPRSFPPVNSGVLAIRAPDRIEQFSLDWEAGVRQAGAEVDQGVLRSLLYHGDLAFLPLGEEYNLVHIQALESWTPEHGALRILHVRDLHERPPGDPNRPYSLEEAIGPVLARKIETLPRTEDDTGSVRFELANAIRVQ